MTYRESRFENELAGIRQDHLYKPERIITTPQGVEIATTGRGNVLNFCANNYLGLANHPEIIEAAIGALKSHGFGMASVRFICGTQDLHKQLEQAIADFLATEDAILYSSCFDANTGLFETLLGEEDAVISDALNHASIIDGIRLCKAARLRFAHGDMADLERQLRTASDSRTRLIVTDGVFSMDGDIAKLDEIVELAEQYGALVMVDDSHGTGVIGPTGRGSGEYRGVLNRIDIITSTLGKALGGGTGGFTASRREIIDLLRQRSRPYLFSNSLAPPLVAAGLKALELITRSPELRESLWKNTAYFRRRLLEVGFAMGPGEHPIIPILLHEAHLAQQMAASLLDEGIYVIGFSYPVVPKGEARIRVQITAAHAQAQLDQAVEAFSRIGRDLGVIRQATPSR